MLKYYYVCMELKHYVKYKEFSDTFSPGNIDWFQQFSIKMFPQWTSINVCAISIK